MLFCLIRLVQREISFLIRIMRKINGRNDMLPDVEKQNSIGEGMMKLHISKMEVAKIIKNNFTNWA